MAAMRRYLLSLFFALAACAVLLVSCGTITPEQITTPLQAVLARLVTDGTLTQSQADIVARLIADLVASILA